MAIRPKCPHCGSYYVDWQATSNIKKGLFPVFGATKRKYSSYVCADCHKAYRILTTWLGMQGKNLYNREEPWYNRLLSWFRSKF